MERTTFGTTDLEVSRICFGSWQFSGQWSAIDEEQAKAAVRRARDLGINFFDTARAYGWGRSESLLAEALWDDLDEDRDDVVLATKGGIHLDGDDVVRDSTRERLRDELEASLQDLRVDQVDLYQVHWPDHDTPYAEVARTLESFKDEGLVRYAGVSNYSADQVAAYQQEAPLDGLQPPYSMLRREAEATLFPYCRLEGIGVLSYGPLAHGLLTGKYGPDATFPDDDWRAHNPWFQGQVLERNLQAVDRLQVLADDLGVPLLQLAVAWVLDHPAVDAAIVGARRPAHVEGVAPATEVTLDQTVYDRVEEILEGAVGIGGATPETG